MGQQILLADAKNAVAKVNMKTRHFTSFFGQILPVFGQILALFGLIIVFYPGWNLP